MPYLIVRTDVRQVPDEKLVASGHARDERHAPETRRSSATAETWDAAMRMARALASCGPVKAGRQRVKVIKLS